MDTSTLFRPFQAAGLSLPNRIVMAPMTRRGCPGGVPDASVAEYYWRRAAGGVGLIITEGTTIGRAAASNHTDIPNFHEPASLAGWSEVVTQVHSVGGKIAPQLWHQGEAREPGSGPHPLAPSEGPSSMSERDIADTVAAYAEAASAAKRIGFDAVELHAAHGYLIDQFFWVATNHRSDRYGGDSVERTRFAVEVVKAVRRAVGPDFPIILRFSQWKVQDYSARLAESPHELERILASLADAGVDIFHASTRRFWVPEFDGSTLNLAGWARKLTGCPAISVGSVGLQDADFMEHLRGTSAGAAVGDIDELLYRLGRDEFDLIAVGRALISDPEWPNKVRRGSLNELRAFKREDTATLV